MTPTTSNSNPIIIIDDDMEDIEIFQEGFKEMGIENEIMVFNDTNKFYDYISKTDRIVAYSICIGLVNFMRQNSVR